MTTTGQRPELTEFVAETRPRLQRALVARFGLDEGMEATSAAMEYAVANWDRVCSMDNPAGYLYRVGNSKAIDALGKRKHLDALIVDPATTDQPVDIDLQRALCRIKPEERVSVVLVYSHGYSYAEAAELLGVPITTVTNHLQRGLTRLRKVLGS